VWVKKPEDKADHFPASSDEVKDMELYLHSPNMSV
jgi:hypothetical protein